jgi:hypothetical protein
MCGFEEWRLFGAGVGILARGSLMTIAAILFYLLLILFAWGTLKHRKWGLLGLGVASAIAGSYSLFCIFMAGLEFGNAIFLAWWIVLSLAAVTVFHVIAHHRSA